MPVPVPLYTKQPAHPVIKHGSSGHADLRPSLFQHVTHSLPAPPRGPPPSFATREEWINSLPDWRRNKPRAVWEDDNSVRHLGRSGFKQGLAVADNAAVIKGAPAQACIPPVSTLLASANYTANSTTGTYPSPAEEADEVMHELRPIYEQRGWHGDVSPFTRADIEMRAQDSDMDPLDFADYRRGRADNENVYPTRSVDRGVFSPLYEETSPDIVRNNYPSSSPVGPMTPFGDYVERAMAEARVSHPYSSHLRQDEAVSQNQFPYEDSYNNCYQCNHYDQQIHQAIQPAPQAAPEPVSVLLASVDLKVLAEPLADWMANFVWKVCTTGMHIHPIHCRPRQDEKRYAPLPHSSLARNVHSLFMSTLLQPSAIFLAMWYIVRLPVYFGPSCLNREHLKEQDFRQELFGGESHLLERNAIEANAPFRLIVLGCMLANKWLDDHTFSNKTWQSISNVHIHSLNKLERLALEIFNHDLSIEPVEWSRWLDFVMNYHMSLSSSVYPQPISRPSTSPHTVIRKAIESLTYANRQWNENPQGPVFLSLDEKQKATRQFEEEYTVDLSDIDLDAEGPLRHEYIPKRRSSGASSTFQPRSQERIMEPMRELPPPARWSPAGDELLYPKAHSLYVAPQPVMHLRSQQYHVEPPPRWPWPSNDNHHLPPPLPSQVYASEHSGYDYGYAPPPSHSRSQSLSYNAQAAPVQGHYRTYSQSRYDTYDENRYHEPNNVPLVFPVSGDWGRLEHQPYVAAYERPIEFHNRIPLKV